MNVNTFVATWLAVLLLAAGGGAALTGADVQTPGSSEESATGPSDVDVEATHDDGTVTVTVTSDGAGVENVTIYADDERVGTTGANGTVTFETNASEELELEFTKSDFEGSVAYQIQDGSLTLVEEEYEYGESEPAESEEETGDDEGDSDEGDDEEQHEERDDEGEQEDD